MPAKKTKPKTKKSTSSTPETVEVVYASPYSFESFINFVSNNFAVILFVGIFFMVGFFSGSLWTEKEMLKNGSGIAAGQPSAVAGAPGAGDVAPPPVDQVPEVTKDDHIRGNRNAKVILVEYSDFECPFCSKFHPTAQQAVDEYGGDVAWVYRHYPLSFHPNAQKAAEGSECVADLVGEDAFWQYGDYLVEVNTRDGKLSPDAIQEAAQLTGVNMAAFNECLDSGEKAALVKEQMDGGAAAGVSGTPGTIIVTKDGGQELVPGALPFSNLQAIIENYL